MNSIPKLNNIVGIDPGRETGFAIWLRREKKFKRIETLTFWEAAHFLMNNREDIYVVIEDPNQNRNIFVRNHILNENMRLRNAQDVGRNKEHAKLLIDLCKIYKIPYRAVRPTKAKLNAVDFFKLTGINKRLSQHCRDAARLVYNY